MPYNIYYRDESKNTKDKIPLFIWLHGAGERGDDNVSQLIHIVPYLASDMVQSKYPSIILAPQCPKDEYWAPVKRFEWSIINGGTVTPPMERLIKLLEQIWQAEIKTQHEGLVLGQLLATGQMRTDVFEIVHRKFPRMLMTPMLAVLRRADPA